jgi:mannose-6-phosphate isomerase-like protein (cupin superfamily)
MPVVVRQDDVVPHENDQRRLWRLITPSTVGAALSATAGVVAYKSRSSPAGPHDHGHDHGHPHDHARQHTHKTLEFIYILSGRGIVEESGARVEVKAGDAFVLRGRTPHAVWSETEEPLMAYCVTVPDDRE